MGGMGNALVDVTSGTTRVDQDHNWPTLLEDSQHSCQGAHTAGDDEEDCTWPRGDRTGEVRTHKRTHKQRAARDERAALATTCTCTCGGMWRGAHSERWRRIGRLSAPGRRHPPLRCGERSL